MTPVQKPRYEPAEGREPRDAAREALLREIADDARREPERYLEESRVPVTVSWDSVRIGGRLRGKVIRLRARRPDDPAS